ncbi:hypothetical protein ACFLU6_16695, partial [Acidobacteriota bacterium]
MHLSKRLVGTVLACLIVSFLPVTAWSQFTVTQGSNTYSVRAVSRFESFDLYRAINDKTGYSKYLSNIKARIDELPGILYDGELYYYKVVGYSVPIADYYRYGVVNAASADTGLEVSQTTNIMFYAENQFRKLYLVVLHDKPHDGDGGVSTFNFSGLPPTAHVAVEDDPGSDVYTLDVAAGTLTVDWSWLECCTDGVAIGGLEYQDFCIDVDFTFGPEITALRFVSHDLRKPKLFPLNMNEPIRICTYGPPGFRGVDPILVGHKMMSQDTVRLSWTYGDIEPVYHIDPDLSQVFAERPCLQADGLDTILIGVVPYDRYGVEHDVSCLGYLETR